ncbi:MAG: class I SAM-dependent methyltransferase [Solirubrobacterales bacterium]
MPEHRFFAAIYDRLLAASEDGGLREMRAELLRDASGRTLELGAGTGHNLPHYTPSVNELVLAEPDRFMAIRLERHLAAEPPASASVEVVDAPAEALPFEDGSFDTVVSTLVLCTVEDPERAIAEAKRVLRADGALLFLEHVRSPDARLAKWQDRVERPWGWFAGGCHPNRRTEESLPACGFEVQGLNRESFPESKWTPWIRPVIVGAARPAP